MASPCDLPLSFLPSPSAGQTSLPPLLSSGEAHGLHLLMAASPFPPMAPHKISTGHVSDGANGQLLLLVKSGLLFKALLKCDLL